MHVDVCTTEDETAKAALLAALAAIGASAEDADDAGDAVLGQGLHLFRTGGGATLTVFADAWSVDLEGPDDLVNRVLAIMAG